LVGGQEEEVQYGVTPLSLWTDIMELQFLSIMWNGYTTINSIIYTIKMNNGIVIILLEVG
jgi:hypothetical protein